MTVVGKNSGNAYKPLTSLFAGLMVTLFTVAVVVMSYLMLSHTTVFSVNRDILRFAGMPKPRSCAGGYAAVDAEGNACISLGELTKRTKIYRARTPEVTYMYCTLPKTGCSFHIDMLHRVSGERIRTGKHHTENQGKIIIDDEKEAAELLANSSVPKYMIVRNPMVRTLSAYLCQFEKWLPEIEKNPATFRRWVKEQFTDFKTWKGVNLHWRAQTESCGYGMRDVQKRFHVFHFEKPAEYVDFLYKIIPSHVLEKDWGENKTDYRTFVLSPHKRTGHTTDKFYDYVGNLETFDLLEKTYRRDIDVLGYRDQVTEMRNVLARITGQVEKRPVPELNG